MWYNIVKWIITRRYKMFKNFINPREKFGRLTFLEELTPLKSKDGRSKRVALCKCDCGNEVIVLFSKLLYGRTKSCGCLKSDMSSSRLKKNNTYETDGEVTKVFDSKGNFALIDTEDLEKVKPYYFRLVKKGYFVTSPVLRNTDKCLLMHRVITDCPDGMVVDHINHNKSDNRKCNLRVCTPQQNSMNKKNIKGYWFRKDLGLWQVEIICKGIKHIIGCFKTEQDAIEARKKAEMEYFKDFAFNA